MLPVQLAGKRSWHEHWVIFKVKEGRGCLRWGQGRVGQGWVLTAVMLLKMHCTLKRLSGS